MKKIILTILLAGFASLLVSRAQTNALVTGTPFNQTNPPPATAGTNLPANTDTNVMSPDLTVSNTSATNMPDTNMAGNESANTNAAAGIPLIQFSDVPLTTAIENLARQANINYLLDPKIGYGQPDQNGQIKTEPTLSIRWENITAENALIALLDNYGLQLVQDIHTGIYRISPKDPSAPPLLITRVIQLKYASVSNMTEAAQSILTDRRSRVLPDSRSSQLIVVATEPEQQAMDTLIDQLDKPTREVLIETKLIEVSSSPETTKGINWSGTLQAQNVAFGNNTTALLPATPPTTSIGTNGVLQTIPGFGGVSTGILGIPQLLANTKDGFGPIGFLNADGVNAVISFLNSSADAQVMSTPRLVTLDNEAAHISVTRGFPVINVTASTANTTAGSTISYTNVGTVLDVTPHITANDNIYLKVRPQISSFFETETKIIAGATYQADVFDFRDIDTQVILPNANTLIMGGLVKDNPSASYTKIPFLGDIPVLGYAFRSEDKRTDKANLLIFITPTIVQDSDFQPTVSHFLQNKPLTRKPPVDSNSMWEGAKPRNWSNPQMTDPDQNLLINEN
jgi:type II secretory pathway component GspD/PulD (secretin)